MRTQDWRILRNGICVVSIIFVLYIYGFKNWQKVSDLDTSHLDIQTLHETIWKPNETVCQKDLIAKQTKKHYFQLETLETQFGALKTLKIYTNDPREDYLSKDIHDNGFWEPHVFNTIYKVIRADPGIGLIDIGANIGAIAIQFANVGRKVIAIEAAYQCVQHLCANIVANGFKDKISIIHNAVSNNHEDVKFVYPLKGEFALGFVEQGNIRNDMKETYADVWKKTNVWQKTTVRVKTVTLNDLLTYPEVSTLRKVFIKMDVQGFEHKVLEAADTFFKQTKLTGIYVEWFWHKGKPSGEFLLKKFADWNFEPFDCNAVLKDNMADLDQNCVKVDYKASDKWSDDILWLPRN